MPLPISEKVKTALDETRMLALGAQILVGFQFRGVFDQQFDRLPALSRWCDGVAVLLMALTLALLCLPGPYHRLVEDGNDSAALHRMIGRVAFLALAPFAISLGIDVAIVGERIVGAGGGALAGAAFAILALSFWYGLGELRKARSRSTERPMAQQRDDAAERTPLHQKIDHLLTEARVILPGAQALLGFQLAIVGSSLAASGAALAVLGLLVGCWIVLPLVARRRRSGQRLMGSDARAPTPL